MGPDQTAPKRSSLNWVHTVSHKLLKHFSRREKQTTFVVIGALRASTNNVPESIQLCYFVRHL